MSDKIKKLHDSIWYNDYLIETNPDKDNPYTGEGIHIVVTDIDSLNQNIKALKKSDIETASSLAGSYFSLFKDNKNYHADMVAGLIAAKLEENGKKYSFGMSPDAKITTRLYGKHNDYSLNPDISHSSTSYKNYRTFSIPYTYSFLNLINKNNDDYLEKGRNGKGIISITSAGNEHETSLEVHKNSDNVLNVGAYNKYGDIESYSNIGSNIDFVGPGKNIVSIRDGKLKTIRGGGTSSAAPIAAGVIARALEANPNATHEDVKKLSITLARTDKLSALKFEKNASDIRDGGGTSFSFDAGAGRINPNLHKAFETLTDYDHPTEKKSIKLSDTLQISIPADGEIIHKFNVTEDFNIHDVSLNTKLKFSDNSENADYLDRIIVFLESPNGTRYKILQGSSVLHQEITKKAFQNYQDWSLNPKFETKIGTHHYMGESSKGEWKVIVRNYGTEKLDVSAEIEKLDLSVKGFEENLKTFYITENAPYTEQITLNTSENPFEINASMLNRDALFSYERGLEILNKGTEFIPTNYGSLTNIISGSGDDIFFLKQNDKLNSAELQYKTTYSGRGDDIINDNLGNMFHITSSGNNQINMGVNPSMNTSHIHMHGETKINSTTHQNVSFLDFGKSTFDPRQIKLEDLGSKGFLLHHGKGSLPIGKTENGLPAIQSLFIGNSAVDNPHLMDRTLTGLQLVSFNPESKSFELAPQNIQDKYSDRIDLASIKMSVKDKVAEFMPTIVTSVKNNYTAKIDQNSLHNYKSNLNQIATNVEEEHGGFFKWLGDLTYNYTPIGYVMDWFGYQTLGQIGQNAAKTYISNINEKLNGNLTRQREFSGQIHNDIKSNFEKVLSQKLGVDWTKINVMDINKNGTYEPTEIEVLTENNVKAPLDFTSILSNKMGKELESYLDITRKTLDKQNTLQNLSSSVDQWTISDGKFSFK